MALKSLFRFTDEPGLAAEEAAQPAERGEKDLLHVKVFLHLSGQCPPVETFMAVEESWPAWNQIGAENGPINGCTRARKDHLRKLPPGVSFSVLVVTVLTTASDRADNLFAHEAGADFNRDAHDYRAVGRNQPLKVPQDLGADVIGAMFQHFHAEDEVEAGVVSCQILRQNE